MIFCVEDDENGRELMVYALCTAGFEAKGFENATSFWEEIKKTRPDLIILDIMLPDEDGISILKKLRFSSVTADIPVIMASAKGSEYDKVKGLDFGADDYLAKPFGMMEMTSRVRAVLRRSQTKKRQEILCVGKIELNNTEHTVKADGKNVELTLKEYELLSLFMMNIEKVFSRDELLLLVWGMNFAGETRTVDVHVATLRQKLEKEGDLIKTVRGVGYKMGELYD